ncbi:MAG: hypothetical protein A2086_05545 [Spirochaetes bacterium GWD1_27_9]|nr:MAG: hypothetical protein A2Z98_16625 [Spirochaetes bacterium GWB1_27_13]OHD21874.1 MAG: hypothetical protein A2Y34_09540 [Spirochaetes bacterium GWC1_27_15]OHD37835.1 MAG: hypothetical protein A2086_05545 [Spirochaetes bacterium GWD1_27_9]
MLKKILLFTLTIFLFSCYSQKIYLNPDKKSGKMIIDYSLDSDYLSILSTALANFQSTTDASPIDPAILIDEQAFKDAFKENKDVTLKVVKIDTKKGYSGHIEISFTDFEKALNLLPKSMVNLAIQRANGTLTVNQVLNFGKMDADGVFLDFINQQKEDDINLYNRLTKVASFKFEVYTTTPMIKTEGVTVSSDKKKIEYSFKLQDLLVNKDKDLKFLISF